MPAMFPTPKPRHSYLTSATAFMVAFAVFVPWMVAAATNELVISMHPLHEGRISPMLFGNFIELLDDLVPGMRAEMLNDRSFEGVTRPANWSYYDGAPNFCDREWERNKSWKYDTNNSFNGSRSIKLTASR